MRPQARLVAAAAYDLRPYDATRSNVGTFFSSVALGPSLHRAILHTVMLEGAPPGELLEAFNGAIETLRVMWIAMLSEGDLLLAARIDEMHASLQHAVASAERAWAEGLADGMELADKLVSACNATRRDLARRPPSGASLVLLDRSRATEPYSSALATAIVDASDAMIALDDVRSVTQDPTAKRELVALRMFYEQAILETIGSWRLGELDAARTAERIHGLEKIVREHERLADVA